MPPGGRQPRDPAVEPPLGGLVFGCVLEVARLRRVHPVIERQHDLPGQLAVAHAVVADAAHNLTVRRFLFRPPHVGREPAAQPLGVAGRLRPDLARWNPVADAAVQDSIDVLIDRVHRVGHAHGVALERLELIGDLDGVFAVLDASKLPPKAVPLVEVGQQRLAERHDLVGGEGPGPVLDRETAIRRPRAAVFGASLWHKQMAAPAPEREWRPFWPFSAYSTTVPRRYFNFSFDSWTLASSESSKRQTRWHRARPPASRPSRSNPS